MTSILKWAGIACAVFAMAGCQNAQTRKASNEEARKVSELNTQLAVAYMRDGENETALGKLNKAIEADDNNPDAWNAFGLLHARLGQLAEAEDSFKRATRLDPTNASANNNFGQFLCQLGRYDEGLARFDQALHNPLYQEPEIAHTNAGLCALRGKKADLAEQHFRSALQINPKLAPALIEMSQISFDLSNYLPARAYLQRYLDVAKHTSRSLWLGIQIETALGDRDAVASYGLQLQKNFPDSNETKLLQQRAAQ